MIEVKVKNIGLDSVTGSPIVMLADINKEEDIYPIWIGVAEAEGIILQKSDVKTPRPLTYDLLKNIILQLGGKVEHVSITDIKENAYIAEIVIEKDGEKIIVDSRPSDAINLALRFNVPIYLNEEVVSKVSVNEIKEANVEQKEEGYVEENEELSEYEANVEPQETEKQQIKEEPPVDEELSKFREFIENIKPEDFMIKDNKRKED